MKIDHKEQFKINVIIIEQDYMCYVSRVNVLGETYDYYLKLVSELENEIQHLSVLRNSIQRNIFEFTHGISIADKIELLPEKIRKLYPENFHIDIVIDTNLLNAQKDRMLGIINEYQRLIIYLEKKVTSLEYAPQSKEKKAEPRTQNIDVLTGIDIDLLKYLSDEFNVDDERFKELTKYNHIYFYLFPIPENDTKEQRAKHKSYKKLIHTEFGFDYGNSQIKVYDPETYIKQLNDLEYKFKESTKL